MANEANVAVCCKLPNGLLLELGSEEEGNYQSVKVAGCSRYIMPNADRNFQDPDVLQGGYSLTMVDKKFWDAWAEKNKNFKPLKKGFIFAAANRNEAAAKSKDNAENKTGLEQIKPRSFGVAPLNTENPRP